MAGLSRGWLAAEGDASRDGFKVRIMQWNTLADALSTSSSDSNFVRCSPSVLEWKTRKDKLLGEIKDTSADIVCLEEVDHFQDFFQPQLQDLGYQGSFLPKTKSPCTEMPDNNGPDGCALFFRQSMFELVSEHRVQLLDGDGKVTSQVALVQQLKLRTAAVSPAGSSASTGENQPGAGLCVAVTHLKSKPSHAPLRTSQGKSLLSALEAMSTQFPLVVCGDFNADPGDEVCKVFEQHRPTLECAYPNAAPDFTTWKFRPGMEACHTIDYVWFESGRLSLRSRLGLPTKTEIGGDGLPCSAYPSDHLALAVDLTFR